MKSRKTIRVDSVPRSGRNHCRSLSEVLSRGYFFYCHDTEGIFTYVSPSIKAVLGYTRSEFLKHFTEYLSDSPVNREVVRHTRQSMLGKRQPPYEAEVYHKDGSLRTLEVLEVPVKEGGRVVAVEGLARDVTEEKRAGRELEAARRTAEERERLVLRYSGDGIVGTDASGNVIFMNAAAERLLGWKSQELEGRPLHPAIHYRKPDGSPYPEAECPILRAILDGRSSSVEDDILWRKDGTGFPASYSAHPIMHEGRPDGVVLTFRDISERKRLEESRDFLSHAILHDLNGPLAIITAAADMATECPAGLAECSNREELKIIEAAVGDMKRLVSDILDINRMESGRMKLERSLHKPAALAAEAAKPIEVVAKSMGRGLRLAVPAGLPAVSADRAVIRRVLENLLGNSLKFTAKGGEVTLSAARAEDFVVFSVSDPGPGIKPANLERIFDKYFQSDQPADTARKGKGLGLTFCRLAVEAHGGTIKAENISPSGCRISFTLPIGGK